MFFIVCLCCFGDYRWRRQMLLTEKLSRFLSHLDSRLAGWYAQITSIWSAMNMPTRWLASFARMPHENNRAILSLMQFAIISSACWQFAFPRRHHQISGEPTKFLTLADWTGTWKPNCSRSHVGITAWPPSAVPSAALSTCRTEKLAARYLKHVNAPNPSWLHLHRYRGLGRVHFRVGCHATLSCRWAFV